MVYTKKKCKQLKTTTPLPLQKHSKKIFLIKKRRKIQTKEIQKPKIRNAQLTQELWTIFLEFFLSIYICLLAIGIDFEGTKRTKVEPISERTIKKRICLGQRWCDIFTNHPFSCKYSESATVDKGIFGQVLFTSSHSLN